MVDGDWDRLRAFVIRDRDEAGYTQQTFADAVGVTVKSINNFENGRTRMRRGTLSRVETVLRWVPGSAQVVLNGGQPSKQLRRSDRDKPIDHVEIKMLTLIGQLTEEEVWQMIDLRRAREGLTHGNDSAEGNSA